MKRNDRHMTVAVKPSVHEQLKALCLIRNQDYSEVLEGILVTTINNMSMEEKRYFYEIQRLTSKLNSVVSHARVEKDQKDQKSE